MSARLASAPDRDVRGRQVRAVTAAVLLLSVGGCRPAGEAQLREGNAAAREGRFADAEAAFALASRARPEDPRPPVLRGHALFQLGRIDEAAAVWNQALERDPLAVEARLGLARVALEARDAGAALAQLSADAGPPSPWVASQLAAVRGWALLERGAAGDAPEALAAAQASLQPDPDSALGLYVQAGALLVLERPAEAQAALDRLTQRHPQSPLGPYGLARLAAARGRAADALSQLEAAKRAAGPSWRPERVAADPAFVFLSSSEAFLALIGK